jgi:hypothetical protein
MSGECYDRRWELITKHCATGLVNDDARSVSEEKLNTLHLCLYKVTAMHEFKEMTYNKPVVLKLYY